MGIARGARPVGSLTKLGSHEEMKTMEFIFSLVRDLSPIIAFGFGLGLFAAVLGHRLGFWRKELLEVALCGWVLGGGGALGLTIYRIVGGSAGSVGFNGILIFFFLFLAGGCAIAVAVPLGVLIALGFTKRLAARAGGASLLMSAAVMAAGLGAAKWQLREERRLNQEAAAKAAQPAPRANNASAVAVPATIPNSSTPERLKGFWVPAPNSKYQAQVEVPYGPTGVQMKYAKLIQHPDGRLTSVGLDLKFIRAGEVPTICDVNLRNQIPGAEQFSWHGARGLIYDVNSATPGMAKLNLDFAVAAGCIEISADFLSGEYSRAELRNFLETFHHVPE